MTDGYSRTEPIVLSESEIENLSNGERVEGITVPGPQNLDIPIRLDPVPDDVALLLREYRYGAVRDWDTQWIELEVSGIPEDRDEMPDEISRLRELGFSGIEYTTGSSVSTVRIYRDARYIAE